MSTDTAKVKWVSDSQQMQADYDKMYAKLAKQDQQLQRIKKSTKDVGDANRQMNAGVKKALDESTTAAEKYRATTAGLRKELDSGRITEERYNAARKAAQAAYKAATVDAKALAKAEAEIERITNRNKTSLDRYNEGLKTAKKHYENGRITAATFRSEVERLNQELKDSDAPNKVAETIEHFAAGVTVVGLLTAGWRAANTELDEYLEKAKKVANLQKTYAEKSREMRDNFKEDATIGSVEALDKTVADISKRTGIDPEVVVEAMTAGLGQKGNRTNKQVAETVENAVRYSRTDSGKAVELTQRAMLLSNVSGVSDMKAVMGFLAESANASAIPSIEKFGATGARSINDAIRRGASPEQAAELFATINKSMGDVEGNRSATATTQLVEQMADFVPQGTGKDARGEFAVPKAQRDAFAAAAKSPMAQLRVLQQSPELRRAFLGESSFETAAKASIEGLLTASPESMQLMAEAQGKVPALSNANAAQLGRAFDEEVARLDSGQVQRNAAGMQGQIADKNRRALEDPAKGKLGAVEEMLFDEEKGFFNDPSLNLPGIDALTRRTSRAGFKVGIAAGRSPEDAARNELEWVRLQSQTGPGKNSDETRTLLKAIDDTLKRIESLNNGQLNEQKQEKADRKVSMMPSAPGQPLLQGWNPALNGGALQS